MKNSRQRVLLCLAITGITGMMLGSAPARAADVKLTNAAFKYGGVNYFRGKAENVNLCSDGEKKTPVGQVNYLAVQGQVPRGKLGDVTVKISGPYTIEWSKYSNTDVNASIKYLKVGGGTGTFSREAAKSANLKLVKFSLDEGQLKRLLNKYADSVRNYLADEGRDGRIVSEVWVVMEANLASQVTTGGSVKGEGSGGGFKVEVAASGSSTTKTSITVPPNTTFAYLLHKVKDWSKGKETIEDMEDDQHGPF